jgi:flagellar biosynthetic protein FliO
MDLDRIAASSRPDNVECVEFGRVRQASALPVSALPASDGLTYGGGQVWSVAMLLAARSLLSDFGPLVAKSVLVLALIALAAYVAMRFLGPRLAERRRNVRMRIVERLALEPRRSQYLVDVDGERLVVGVTEHGIAFHEVTAAPCPPGPKPEGER